MVCVDNFVRWKICVMGCPRVRVLSGTFMEIERLVYVWHVRNVHKCSNERPSKNIHVDTKRSGERERYDRARARHQILFICQLSLPKAYPFNRMTEKTFLLLLIK